MLVKETEKFGENKTLHQIIGRDLSFEEREIILSSVIGEDASRS